MVTIAAAAGVIPGRPTLYKGIRMRSRLEADYAAHLDRYGYRWEYEPECFANGEGQWLPDFGSSFADHGPLAMFTEVKPAEPLKRLIAGCSDFVEHVDAVLRKVEVAWSSRPDALLELVFWQWGEGPYLTITGPRWGHPWKAQMGRTLPDLLWVGMGQYARLREA
jgi:hypothetical protein